VLKKYILAAMLVAASVIGGYGCMQLKWENNENRNMSTAGALEYMEQRYGEKFEYIKSHGLHYTPNSRKIFVSCESFPGKEILVSIVKDGKEIKYYDNYMEYYFAEQVNDFIVDIAKGYFDDITFRVSISASRSNSAITPKTAFEEYIFAEYYFVRGFMEIGESGESIEETIHEFANELVRLGIQFSISMSIPSTDEGYNIRHFNEDEEIYFRRK